MSVLNDSNGGITLFDILFILSVLMTAEILDTRCKDTEILNSIDEKLDRLVTKSDNEGKTV